MKIKELVLIVLAVLLACSPWLLNHFWGVERVETPPGRTEVVFWHFWGGADREIVRDVVDRFNDSQERFFVREVAMPGNNLQSKLFLSTTGGDPPDLINQDDPVMASWAARGVIQPMSDVADRSEVEAVERFLYPAARKLSTCNQQLYGVCNGLDIRALYYNRSALDQFGCEVPKTIRELDEVSRRIAPDRFDPDRDFYAYLPDSRRLWAWGYVFGGEFVDGSGKVDLTNSKVVAASQWMASYSRRYGAENIAAFRTGDQSLPGKTFPLLPVGTDSNLGRYAMLMDGQWRTRDIRAFNRKRIEDGKNPIEFGVAPLPYPEGGRANGGWVNGNVFMIPKGAANSEGAWEFIKFWIGYSQPKQAVRTCVAGGWIPVSDTVVQNPDFQTFLEQDELFRVFVELAASPNQFPIPMVPAGPKLKRSVESASYRIMNQADADALEILAEAGTEVQKSIPVGSYGSSEGGPR